MNRSVTVTARVPDDVALSPKAMLRCRIEDLNAADQRPMVIGSGAVPVDGKGGSLRVVLPVTERLDPSTAYGVFVHLDASGTGEVEVGDAITTATVPVLTGGYADQVDVQLHKVG